MTRNPGRKANMRTAASGHFRRSVISAAIAALFSSPGAGHGAQPGQVLPPGTLPQLRALYSGQATVNAPVAISGGNLLTINQTSQRVILDWNNFNIARGSEVRFNQPSASSSALNRIFDADPSIIQGRLSANGQIFLINQNGILFDRGSQVNVHTLIASTLNVTEDRYLSGLTNYQGAAPNFQGTNGYSKVEIGSYGPAGEDAVLTALPGGGIYVFAPQIVNNGIIKAPDGQVMLAAGQTVRLFQDPNADFTMRGLFVEVQADAVPLNLSSLVTNLGQISADRGNVTLAGLAVNQMNRASAKTAVNVNGSIWLLAKDRLTLGAGSITETPIAADSTTTLTEDQDFTPYRPVVRLQGDTIDVQGKVISPSGNVIVQANRRVYFGMESAISTAGSWADVDPAKNLLTIKLTTNDLRDASLQKGGFLLGKTVTVDMRNGNPSLFDISAYAGSVSRTVAEKTATGGDITINVGNAGAPGEIVLREGAVLDVSGGGYRYSGARLDTTQLLSNGRLYEISSASANLLYDSIISPSYEVRHAKWGVTESFSSQLRTLGPYQSAYVEGKSAGTISLNASNLILDGTLKAVTTAGRLQMTPDKLPDGGRLILGNSAAEFDASREFRLKDVIFAAAPAPLPEAFGIDAALPANRDGVVYLPAGLIQTAPNTSKDTVSYGFDRIEVYANGRIDIPAETKLEIAPPGGSADISHGIKLVAHDIAISGSVRAPSGNIEIKALNGTPGSTGSSSFLLGDSALIDVAGLWINDTVNPQGLPGAGALTPSLLSGGTVSISSTDVILSAGSIVDVSGGARLGSGGKLTAGNGGTISIDAGGDGSSIVRGTLDLGGDLRGYSAGGGGTLNVTAYSAIVSGAATAPEMLALDPDFFRRGGFAAYSVNGRFGLTVASGTEILPLAQTLVVDRSAASRYPSGGSIREIGSIATLPTGIRKAARVSLSASQSDIGVLTVESGARIATDPGASIALTAGSSIVMNGTLEAPAGSIKLSAKRSTYGDDSVAAVHIGSDARLISRGFVQTTPNVQGLLTGQVLRGGEITVEAFKGALVVDSGALIDVSAVQGTLDLPYSSAGQTGYARTSVAGDAGTVLIKATETSRIDGRFVGTAASGAAGGSFAFEFARHGDVLIPDVDHRLVFAPDPLATVPESSQVKEAYLSWASLRDGGFDKLRLFSSEEVQFRGNVDLHLGRSVRLDAPVISMQNATAVRIAAPHVVLASSGDPLNTTSEPRPFATLKGTATETFSVNAGLLDIYGTVTMNGASSINLHSSGDIRGTGKPVAHLQSDGTSSVDRMTGALISEANITLTAAQIYPTSASDFTFAVNKSDSLGARTRVDGGSITILQGVESGSPVLSAGGALAFDADGITHNGTVKAPLGTITFNAGTALSLGAGSLTSVSADGLTIPFGGTVNGLSWVYNNMVARTTPPSKRIALNGQDISVGSGAVLDVSGGGDLQAVEWVPGIGGSRDYLLSDNTYAILPEAALEFAPYDSHLLGLKDLGFGKDSSIYNSVYLAAGSGVPEGRYVLLPGYYALLPGAYVVTRQTGGAYADVQPGRAARLLDGTTIVAGKLAVSGTSITEQRWSGFSVRPGSAALREAEYRISNANFFADQARAADLAVPRLPGDAGRVSITALQDLDFEGTLRGQAGGGRGAEVDISAAQLAVVAQKGVNQGPAGAVELEASTLSALNASLLLGGVRSDSSAGTRIDVVAGSVTVAQGADLAGPEIILAATDTVVVENGAVVRTAGVLSGTASDLLVDATASSGGALLRVSSGNQVAIGRGTQVDRSRGVLDIREGALISASKSMLLDATRSISSAGTLEVADGGFLGLGAGNIRIGQDAPAAADSLLIGNEQLAGFERLDTVSLRSYTGIDFYGDVTLGSESFNRITLDAAAINGFNGGTVNVRARNVTLQNGASTTVAAINGGTGNLDISADQVVLGSGKKAISGFGTVVFSANDDITGAGTGDLRVAGDLKLESARVTGSLKSDQAIAAVAEAKVVDGSIVALAEKVYYSVALKRPETLLPSTGNDALGAKLAITGSSIDHAGTIELPAGSVTLTATGAKEILLPDGALSTTGIVLRDGSRISASGAARTFGATQAYAAAGTIRLSSAGADIDAKAGSTVDLSGSSDGGDAGKLFVTTSGLTGYKERPFLIWDGELNGSAQAGYRQGSANLDLSTLPNFSALNAKLNQGGFSESRDIRVRNGNVTIAGKNEFTQRPADIVIARHFKLSADDVLTGGGSIFVGGIIDASDAAGGGTIELNAMNDMVLSNDSFLLARGTSAAAGATDAYSHGGRVELSSRTGTLTMASGAVIDVSAQGGGKSDGGNVRFSAGRTYTYTRKDDGTVVDAGVKMALQGTVNVGAGENGGQTGFVTIEGVHVYKDVADTVTASVLDSAVMVDYEAFMDESGTIKSLILPLTPTGSGLRIQGVASAAAALHVSGGVELQSSGDMIVSSAWDLTSSDWMPDETPGRLTLRAARNLKINSTLGLPNDVLPEFRTWDIRLVGGGDLDAADVLAVRAPRDGVYSGDVVLRNEATFTYTSFSERQGVWINAAQVRTGTGRIDISAGRDFLIEKLTTTTTRAIDPDTGREVQIDAANLAIAPWATVYTGGRPGVTEQDADTVPTQSGSYPIDGGDISIFAQRDAKGIAQSKQWINNWLRRTTGATAVDGAAGSWWVNRSTFQHHIGTFGGGNISITAGNDIVDLYAASATSGRAYTDADLQTRLDVQGGGDLLVGAGRNIVGGEYLVARGNGIIDAGDSVGAGTRTALFLMGESDDPAQRGATFGVAAANDISLQNISNPTILTLFNPSGIISFQRKTYFFTYAEENDVRISSLSGDVRLRNLATKKQSQSNTTVETVWSDIVPSRFSATAFQGSILGERVSGTDSLIKLFPSSTGRLELLAGSGIGTLAIDAIDAAPAALPTWRHAIMQQVGNSPLPGSQLNLSVKSSGSYASVANQYDYIVAAGDSIYDSRFSFPKQALVTAGLDIENVDLGLQNLLEDDVSIVRAGRDFRYLPRHRSGFPVVGGGGSIQISGPGRLLVQAGRNINFGLSPGIAAVGDTTNFSLATSKSAALTMLAGVTGEIGFDDIDNLFVELKAAGVAQDAVRGERAVGEVFTQANTGPGDITMFFSSISTLGGSGIDVLAPGGNINVGLPTPQAGDIGIITTLGGNVRSYLARDFNVNLSKLVTLQGGDILIYTKQGNIDAGRGARTSRTTQAPRRVIQPDGTIAFLPPQEASGSGIRTLTSDPDGPGPLATPKAGDVYLFAPAGYIDAGEAGVSSAGNIFVAALQVLNSSNFSAAGSSTGVPIAPSGGISAGLSGASSVGASAAKSAEEATKALAAASPAVTKEIFRPTFISVEVLGVGEEGSRKEDGN